MQEHHVIQMICERCIQILDKDQVLRKTIRINKTVTEIISTDCYKEYHKYRLNVYENIITFDEDRSKNSFPICI
jgi:hypothetical protein